MADSIKEVLGAISKAAREQGVEFYLHRKGKKHFIYHLGDKVVLPVPHSQVPSRIKFEMFKQCEAELGYRWWQPENRRSEEPVNVPTVYEPGYRGPRCKRAATT